VNTRKIGIPLFLALGVLALRVFVLNPLLMVLLMFTTDIATMSVSTDQASPSPLPYRWDLRRLMATALGLAALLLLLSGAVYWLAAGPLRLSGSQTQTLVFVWLVFGGGQAVLHLTRGREFFWMKPRPGRWLILVTAFDVLAVTLVAVLGWLMAPVPAPLVAAMCVLVGAFLICADLLKVLLLRWGGPGAAAGGA
jgi:H+-transporting ATPase